MKKYTKRRFLQSFFKILVVHVVRPAVKYLRNTLGNHHLEDVVVLGFQLRHFVPDLKDLI